MPILYFEGVDGVGKTTVMKEVAKVFAKMGTAMVLTKEPGGPVALEAEWKDLSMPYGKKYRGFRHLCVDNPDIPQIVKRALYRADSLYNWEVVVRPNKDKLVLCDRSWMSDLAYGSVLTEFGIDRLYDFNESLAPGQIGSSYCIYLYCDPEIREARLSTNTVDHMDKLGPQARDKIHEAYIETFENFLPEDRFFMVDTGQPLSETVEEIVTFIQGVIKNPQKDFVFK